MAGYDLKDYKEVSERIIDLRQKYPDASLQSEVILWPTDALPFIAVKATCYRTRKDESPGVGLAWEPFPGKTPYTRDSELQNAETSAWGRAIVAALASDTKQGVASADEVRNRRSGPPSQAGSPMAGPGPAGGGVSIPPTPPASSSGDRESEYRQSKEASGQGPTSEGIVGASQSTLSPEPTAAADGAGEVTSAAAPTFDEVATLYGGQAHVVRKARELWEDVRSKSDLTPAMLTELKRVKV